MGKRQWHVTIRVVHEPSAVRADAVLGDDDRLVLVGTGQVIHDRATPQPAREEVAVARALQDLARRLAKRDEEAHLAPAE